MEGKFIYIVKTDKDGRDRGVYIQPTRRIFPTHAETVRQASSASPSRVPIVVELPFPVEVDKDYYPINK